MRKMNIQHTVLEFPCVIRHVTTVVTFLQSCAHIMEVTPSTFHIDMFPSEGEHPIGFTATVSFQESYCALDTWPEAAYCHLNMVSCKQFDEQKVHSLVSLMFGVDPGDIIQFDVFKRERKAVEDGT